MQISQLVREVWFDTRVGGQIGPKWDKFHTKHQISWHFGSLKYDLKSPMICPIGCNLTDFGLNPTSLRLDISIIDIVALKVWTLWVFLPRMLTTIRLIFCPSKALVNLDQLSGDLYLNNWTDNVYVNIKIDVISFVFVQCRRKTSLFSVYLYIRLQTGRMFIRKYCGINTSFNSFLSRQHFLETIFVFYTFRWGDRNNIIKF